MTAQRLTFDSQGRPYNDSNPGVVTSGAIAPYLAAQGGTATLPLVLVCLDNDANALGHFETSLTVNTTAGTWSVPTPPSLGDAPVAVETTTTLNATASDGSLVLTATVTPTAAAGSVEFRRGTELLDTVPVVGGSAQTTVTAPELGQYQFSASFVPDDATAYAPSTVTEPVTVGTTAGTGDIEVTLGVPGSVEEPGSLTLTVPDAASVNLAGQRDSGNTRVTATGDLPAIQVIDTRRDNLLTPWQVNVQASEFTGAAGTLSSKFLGWAPGLPSIAATDASPLDAQAGPAIASSLDDASSAGLSISQLLAKSIANGRGTTTLNADLNLAIPADTDEGDYTSTITVTLIGG